MKCVAVFVLVQVQFRVEEGSLQEREKNHHHCSAFNFI